MFEWITSVVARGGYLGVAGLMLAENVFPPIPSELIMPLAGYVAARGELSFMLVVLAGVVGSVLGALPWYYLGRVLGRERICALAARHGRWLTLDEREVGQAISWFERHGAKAVFLGRLVPAVRTLISMPAGVARMPMLPFLAWSTAGTLIWTTALAAGGLLLKESYTRIGDSLDAISKIIVGLVVLTYLYRLVAGGRLGRRIAGWASTLRRDVHAVYLCARDPRVAWYAKTLAFLVAAYAASPIDLIPDFLPVVGHLDDLLLVPLGIYVALRMIPADVVEDNRRRAEQSLAAPRDWRVAALFVAIWGLAAAFVIRWALERYFAG